MSGVASLSPKLQEYLLGAATDGTGGLATEVVFSLLRTVRNRVRERFTPPLQQQALSRAVTAALAQALSYWVITDEETTHYQDLFRE